LQTSPRASKVAEHGCQSHVFPRNDFRSCMNFADLDDDCWCCKPRTWDFLLWLCFL